MNKKPSIIATIVAVASIAMAGLFVYKWYTIKTAVPKIGDPVMDRLHFTDENTPASKKYTEALYNANKSDMIIVGSWTTSPDGNGFIKEYDTSNTLLLYILFMPGTCSILLIL